jgi:hypothetical protein
MRTGWYPVHCLTSVSSSFSTFLCLSASWTGVDKNIRTICAEQLSIIILNLIKVKNIGGDKTLGPTKYWHLKILATTKYTV